MAAPLYQIILIICRLAKLPTLLQACQMLNALENYYWRYCSASELVNMILAFIETRALSIFDSQHFLELSESMVQLIMNRNLEVKEIHKYEFTLNS